MSLVKEPIWNVTCHPSHIWCDWYFDDADGAWQSACEGSFVFDEGDPKGNDFNYCPKCGKTISVFVPEDDES